MLRSLIVARRKDTEAVMNLQIALSSTALTSALPAQRPAASAAQQVLQPFASVKRWLRDQDIVYQGNAAGDWYCVISGACRQYMVQPDGRRQIVDVLLPGDFFGFAVGGAHRFAVQAIAAETIVASYPRREIEAAADADPQVGRAIRERAFSTIARLQDHLLVVGTMTAAEKVRAFLCYMFERLPSSPDSGIILPVSRYDIADQLGISVETVSRAITELKTSGAIHLGGPRNVQMVEPRSLEG
jgi:CRP/FNR family nitrogen fixation transcriptional regulator